MAVTNLNTAWSASGASSKTLAIGAVAATNTLLAVAGTYSATSGKEPTGVTAPSGTALTKVSTLATSGNYTLSLWALYTSGGESAGNVTFTWSAATGGGVLLGAAYAAGLATSVTTDGTNGAWRSAGLNTTIASGNVTTANANDTLIGCAFADGSGSTGPTANNSFTAIGGAYSGASDDWYLWWAYRDVTATGTFSTFGTWNSSPLFEDGKLMVALQAAGGGGGGGGTTQQTLMLRGVGS